MTLRLLEALESQNVSANLVAKPDMRQLTKQWLEAAFPFMKNHTGRRRFGGFYWNPYAANAVPRLNSLRATDKYQSMPIEPYYILNQDQDTMYACSSASWPDLMIMPTFDLYLFPESMGWTYVMTHEKNYVGPFFAFNSKW